MNRISCPISDLDEEAVRNFLRSNPVFLEDYVMKHVDQDRLERWLIRKTRKLKNKGAKKPGNSLDYDNNKQSGELKIAAASFRLLCRLIEVVNKIKLIPFITVVVLNNFLFQKFQILTGHLCQSGRYYELSCQINIIDTNRSCVLGIKISLY